MKKAIALVLVMCAALSLCACGSIKSLRADNDFDLDETLDKYETVISEYMALLERVREDPADEVLKEEYASFVAKYGDTLQKVGIDLDAELSDEFIQSVKDIFSTLDSRVKKLFADVIPK